jgi:threonine/homoserine/homoserine lactone efflux protein
LVQVAACAAGLSWLLLSSSLAFAVVKYVGAAYLIYLGIRRLLSRSELEMAEAGVARSAARMFGEGILVNILNPKLALFFLAFLPQFVDPARGAVAGQVAVFGVVFVLIGLCTDGSFALLAGTVGPWLRGSTRFLRGERYVVGGTFIGLGIVAALTPVRRSHS